MKTFARGRAVASCVAAVLAAAPAAHAEGPCAPVAVKVGLSAAWAPSIAELRSRVAALSTSDCIPMSLSLEARNGDVWLVATAPDGRRAERRVARPRDVVPVALGLLAAIPVPGPPAPAPALAVAAPPATAPAAPVARAPAPPPVERVVPPSAPPAPPTPRLWLGLAAGLRLTAPRGLTVLDVEARADVPLGGWVAFGAVRSAVLSCLGEQGVDCDVYEDFGAGAGLARRFRAGVATLDVGVEPSLVWMHMELDGATEAESVTSSHLELFVDGSARLGVPLTDRTGLTVTVDLGLSPTLLASPQRLPPPAPMTTAPPFPAYGGGVRIGLATAAM